MILFTVLLLTLIMLLFISIVAISAGGAVMIIIFGDVIVCMALIIWIMKKLTQRKR